MGQSAQTRRNGHIRPAALPDLSIFATEFGWFGLLGRNGRLLALHVGHASPDEVRRAAAKALRETTTAGFRETDWQPALRRRLEGYCRGTRDEFSDLVLDPGLVTEFQKRVIAATRRIGYGETLSYGELARAAGFPRAARAVGSVMASNRFPIVVPCHRVVASGGRLGGYSSPQGPRLKEQLLALERESLPSGESRRSRPPRRSAARRPRRGPH